MCIYIYTDYCIYIYITPPPESTSELAPKKAERWNVLDFLGEVPNIGGSFNIWLFDGI